MWFAVAPLKEVFRGMPFVPTGLTVKFRSGTQVNIAGVAVSFWLHPAPIVAVIHTT